MVQRDTLAFSTFYWSFLVFLSVRPSLLDQDAWIIMSKYKQFQDQIKMSIFNQLCFTSPWYNGDNPIGGGMAGTLVFCYRARTIAGSDVAFADVCQLWSRSAEPLTKLGRICCWDFVIHCGRKYSFKHGIWRPTMFCHYFFKLSFLYVISNLRRWNDSLCFHQPFDLI